VAALSRDIAAAIASLGAGQSDRETAEP